jgi:hypothetical protein
MLVLFHKRISLSLTEFSTNMIFVLLSRPKDWLQPTYNLSMHACMHARLTIIVQCSAVTGFVMDEVRLGIKLVFTLTVS